MKRFLRNHAILLTLLLVLAVMFLIYCFSAQDAEASDKSSGAVVHWLLSTFCRDFDHYEPHEQMELKNAVSHYVRKSAHFTEYALLGFSLLLHFKALGSRFRIALPKLFSQLIGSAYAISDELHQKLVSGRSGQISDVLLDSVGVLFGVLILRLCLQIHERRTQRIAASPEIAGERAKKSV